MSDVVWKLSDVEHTRRSRNTQEESAWNDPFFLPGGAEAFRRDIPDAKIHFFDTGHFALETHEIAAVIRDFLAG